MPKRDGSGAKLKLTDRLASDLAEKITSGETMAASINHVGVSMSSVVSWKRRGKADREAGNDTVFARFVQILDAAYLVKDELMQRLCDHVAATNPDELPDLAKRIAGRIESFGGVAGGE